jgi:crotonobetainyl-CoA:carnitine CoA-transferase CaiB-like acyl-CoA transferase
MVSSLVPLKGELSILKSHQLVQDQWHAVAEPGSLAGQHTEAILSEPGYSAEAIADLRDRKVVA